MGLNMKGITVSGRALASNVSGSTFAISPSVESKSVWDLSSDGPLNLGTYGEWTIVPDGDITVSTKMWGAGGARGFTYTQTYATGNSNQGPGGSGGYSTATITLKAGVSYILRVGQGGARSNVPSNATYLAGGANSVVYGGTQGGGYTGIFKTSVSQGNTLLMAGGGGGGGDASFAGGVGGGGGGTTAGHGSSAFNSQGGYGGTQVAGGSASPYNSATAGTALTGGRAANDVGSNAGLGGGGGGYYGGGGANVGGGGGGSGYVSTDPDVASGSTTAASGNTPANSSDPDRDDAAQGGNNTIGNTATGGRAIISLV